MACIPWLALARPHDHVPDSLFIGTQVPLSASFTTVFFTNHPTSSSAPRSFGFSSAPAGHPRPSLRERLGCAWPTTLHMSFLHDTLLPGSAGVYLGGTNAAKEQQRTLRKTKSHAAIFTPLVQLVRNPFKIIGDAVGSFNALQESSSFRVEIENRRQLLYIRLKNVSF